MKSGIAKAGVTGFAEGMARVAHEFGRARRRYSYFTLGIRKKNGRPRRRRRARR